MNRLDAKQRAEELVAQMTIEEAASQLNYKSPAIPRLNIPEYNWWNEALHGVARAGTATCFPQAIGLGATFDTDLLHRIGQTIALETRAKYNAYSSHGDRSQYKGLTMWSPNINIFRDPRWGRGQETYGEDPALTAELGCAFINGLQTEKDGFLMTAACAKHFAVHSGPEALRHEFDAKVSQKDLWETYLPAFEACITEANVEAVMGAYNRTNGEPCCAHNYLMNEVLRDKWQFPGHFVSDCWALRDFHENHKVTKRPEDSAALALKTGCDVNCGCTYEHLMTAYQHKKVSKEEIKRSAVRLFTTRFLLGMFDQSSLDEIPYNVVGCKEHLALAYEAAVKSCVLLKNDGTLPLQKSVYKTIAVIGPNADNVNALLGNYYGTPARTTTLLEGIRTYCDALDIQLHYAQGSQLFKEPRVGRPHENYRITEAAIAAENADMVILCVGLDATLEGEQCDVGNEFPGGDRPDLLLPKVQRELVDIVIATGKPVILINASGSPMDLSAYENQVNAILQVWYPGGEGGNAVADILFGAVSPAGKLPITFYYDDNTLPDMTDYSMQERTYRYLSETPWKPFGYGLTYSTITIEDIKIQICDNATGNQPSATGSLGNIQIADNIGEITWDSVCTQDIHCTITCSNTGSYDISDVLQVYVHVNGSEYEVPNKKLVAFKRIELKKEETGCFQLTIPSSAFTVVNENGDRIHDGSGASIFVRFSA